MAVKLDHEWSEELKKKNKQPHDLEDLEAEFFGHYKGMIKNVVIVFLVLLVLFLLLF